MANSYAETTAMSLPLLRWRQYTATTLANDKKALNHQYVITVVTPAVDSDQVTLTLGSNHRLKVGDLVRVDKSGNLAFDGRFTVLELPAANKATVLVEGSEGVAEFNAHASCRLRVPSMAQRAIFLTPSTNSVAVTIGPDDAADCKPLAAGSSFEIQAPNGGKFDLQDWYARSGATADQVLTILFL